MLLIIFGMETLQDILKLSVWIYRPPPFRTDALIQPSPALYLGIKKLPHPQHKETLACSRVGSPFAAKSGPRGLGAVRPEHPSPTPTPSRQLRELGLLGLP